MRHGRKDDAETLSSAVGSLGWYGSLLVIVLVLVVAVWGAQVALPKAVLAEGVLRAAAPTVAIRHTQSGELAEIAVAEGDRVARGDLLVRMDVQALQLKAEALERDLLHLRIEQRRYLAGLSDAVDLELSEADEQEIKRLKMDDARNDALSKMRISRRLRQETEASLRARAQGLERTVRRLQERLAFETRQIESVAKIVKSYETLRAGGRVKATELERFQRTYLGLQASAAETHADLARAELDQSDVAHERVLIIEREREEFASRLTALERKILERAAELEGLRVRIDAARLRSPIDGTVMNLRHGTVGGVVPPYEVILEVVPDDVALLVDLRIDPKHASLVLPGEITKVTVAGANSLQEPPIDAEVLRVSPNAITENQKHPPHFIATLRILQAPFSDEREAQNPPRTLRSGQPVSAQLVTGSNTLFQYLIAPFRQTFQRAFTEQ